MTTGVSQCYYLLDKNNELIQASHQLINKSEILTQHFNKHPSKVFKLNYSKDDIDALILKLNDEYTGPDTTIDDDMINELCEYLNVRITKSDNHPDELKSFITELYVPDSASYIYESMMDNMQKYQQQHVESTYSDHVYKIIRIHSNGTVDKKPTNDNNPTIVSCLNKMTFTTKSLKEREFFEKYKIIKNGTCEKTILSSEDTTNNRFQFAKETILTEVVIINYNVGKCATTSIPKILINPKIFDQVITNLIDYTKKMFVNCKTKITEIHKNYETYIVKIKVIVKSTVQTY